jgi:hypothetical protein
MPPLRLLSLALAAATPAALAIAAPEAPACVCDAPPPAAAPATETGHPLRGVIVEVLPARQSLLVKHEEIPGVMRAMTMLLKVDAPTLAAARKDQAITATLVRRADGWWLRDVTPLAPAP